MSKEKVETINKADIVESIAKESGLTKKNAEAALKGFITTIMNGVASGKKAQLVGFGNFEPKARKARLGRNPRTGDEIEIPATVVPVFHAAKAFKDKVKGIEE